MFYNAKRKEIDLYNTKIDYISFGTGSKNLIIIPGLGEGFVSFKGVSIPFALIYKKFAKKYKVYVFSRRRKLPKKFDVKDMADDYIKCMNILGIEKASILGVSLGGMIAQEIAIKKPLLIEKLILVVTIPKTNKMLEENVKKWIALAKKKDYKGIMLDTCEKSYTGLSLKIGRIIYRIVSIFKQKDFERFITEANACLNHNALDNIKRLNNNSLIIGGGLDKVLGIEGSIKLHELIDNSEIFIYKKYSHAAYEQAHDFQNKVLDFLNK